MRLRNVKNADLILKESPYFLLEPTQYRGKFGEVFLNQNPIHLEIGTGKGQFLIEMARKFPDINFVGMEKYDSVLVRAIQKCSNENLPNLKFICMDAKNLETVFDHEVETIYLNFSDPWPKNRHRMRRLTSPIFLKIYDGVFQNDAKIIQKTDNLILFSSSLEQLSQYGYILKRVSLDLHATDIPNVETEYEQRFSKMGIKINYLEAQKANSKIL